MQGVKHPSLDMVSHIKLTGAFKDSILRGSVLKENVVLQDQPLTQADPYLELLGKISVENSTLENRAAPKYVVC